MFNVTHKKTHSFTYAFTFIYFNHSPTNKKTSFWGRILKLYYTKLLNSRLFKLLTSHKQFD